MGGCRLDSFGAGWGPEVDLCQHSNEPSGSIRFGEDQK